MEKETKSVIKIGLNSDNQVVVDFDYTVFQEIDDIEPIYIIIAQMRREERNLLDIVDDIENGDVDGISDIDELLGGGLDEF